MNSVVTVLPYLLIVSVQENVVLLSGQGASLLRSRASYELVNTREGMMRVAPSTCLSVLRLCDEAPVNLPDPRGVRCEGALADVEGGESVGLLVPEWSTLIGPDAVL